MEAGWSEFLTISTMIGASFVFIYTEIKSLRTEMKSEMNESRKMHTDEIEQSKIDIFSHLTDIKQTFKNDLFGHRADLKQDIHDIKDDVKSDRRDLQQEIQHLAEKIAKIEGILAFLSDDHPINYPPYAPPPKTE